MPKCVSNYRARYLALSHCWGKTKHILTTKDTLEKHKSAISFQALSKNFQDAVLTTRALGECFLWIDSLCIIQDSSSDWETESARMGSLYKHSLLTIAAIDASDGRDGFLARRTPPCAMPYKTSHPIDGCQQGELWVSAWAPPFADSVDEGPLNQRSWTMQERLLSARILHFGKYLLMWECRMQTESEGDPSTRQIKFLNSKSGNMVSYEPTHFEQLLFQEVTSPLQRDGLIDIWHAIVDQYSHRSLSYVTDKLPAISGLASEFQRITGDEYCAGLWRRDFPHTLCWEPSLPCKEPSMYLAPSWSWASLETGVSYPGFSKHRKSHVELLEVKVSASGLNPLGRVKNGFIRLSGRLLECHPRHKDGPFVVVHFANGDKAGTLEAHYRHWPISKSYCLLLMEQQQHYSKSSRSLGNPFTCTSMLLLEEVAELENTFRRFGVINRANWTDQWNSVDKRVINLV